MNLAADVAAYAANPLFANFDEWVNEFYLNIGLNEGEEWFGTYHTATTVEFTVLGDTINHAGRLSDFARYGAVWATKNLIGKLSPEEREGICFGIRRVHEEDREIWVPETYSRLSNLIDPGNGKFEKFRDIATLAIAEIREITREDGTSRPGSGIRTNRPLNQPEGPDSARNKGTRQ